MQSEYSPHFLFFAISTERGGDNATRVTSVDHFNPSTRNDDVDRRSLLSSQTNKILSSCLNNASICEKCGDQDKAKTWKLIHRTIQNYTQRAAKVAGDSHNNDSMSRRLVENILTYYESRGDVQTLATIVALLRSISLSKLFLKTGHETRYNLYISRYSDLLYGWNLLTLRAAFLKCLTPPDIVQGQQAGVQDHQSNSMNVPTEIVFRCSRCGKTSEKGSGFCSNCQDFAFRCSICDHAVRGLFTLCNA